MAERPTYAHISEKAVYLPLRHNNTYEPREEKKKHLEEEDNETKAGKHTFHKGIVLQNMSGNSPERSNGSQKMPNRLLPLPLMEA